MIKFTADYEMPDCMCCDYVNSSGIACKKCGPEHGWGNYQRTVDGLNLTKDEEKLVINYLRENTKNGGF